MTNELKPCPFCGGDAELFESEESEDVYDPDTLGFLDTEYVTVHCIICRSCGIGGIYNSQDKAIEAWNTRAERTCHMRYVSLYDEDDIEGIECDECGYTQTHEWTETLPAFCLGCGAKVVSE